MPALLKGILAAAVVIGTAALAAPARAATSAPPPPVSLRVTAVTDTSITVAWDPVPGAAYTAYLNGRGGVFETDATTVTFSGLVPNTSATAVVMSRINWEYSERVSISTSTLPDTSRPSAPAANVTSTANGRATLSWPRSTDDDLVSGYRVFAGGVQQVAQITVRSPVTAVIRHLSPGTERTFTVRAVDRSGNISASSAPVHVLMPPGETVPPSAPTSLTFDWSDGTFRWQPSTDNADSPAQLEYSLYVDGAEVTYVTGGRTSSDFFFDGPYCVVVLPVGTHTYTVRAVDSSGNTSAASNALALTN